LPTSSLDDGAVCAEVSELHDELSKVQDTPVSSSTACDAASAESNSTSRFGLPVNGALSLFGKAKERALQQAERVQAAGAAKVNDALEAQQERLQTVQGTLQSVRAAGNAAMAKVNDVAAKDDILQEVTTVIGGIKNGGIREAGSAVVGVLTGSYGTSAPHSSPACTPA